MVTPINVGKNGIDNQEWKTIEDRLNKLKTGEKLSITDGYGKTKEYTKEQLEDLGQTGLANQFSTTGDANDPNSAAAKKAQTELDSVQAKMDSLMKAIKDGKATEAQAKDMAALIKQANTLMGKGAKSFNMAKYNTAAGLPEGGNNPFSGKAQVTMGGGGQPAGGQAQTYSGTTGGGFQGPAGWSAQTWGGGGVPNFNSDTYMKTMAMTDNVMSSWDQVNKNTSRGKQLMQLFFYFAKMAESGSMDSMYQFMKFITYIISKDKAKQQIEMGKKLIQLQELSRSWTNKLMNVQTNSADPAASNELMKTMTIVKSETDAIATSQKLISQMMEEFAQVVETLTNTTKAALETAGRIKRTVSVMR